MSLDRTAKGIVLVPSLLLGGAFLAAAAWLDGPAAENRGLAIGLGCTLMAVGLLAQWLPESRPGAAAPADDDPEGTAGEPDGGG
jgi:hypothetical protein